MYRTLLRSTRAFALLLLLPAFALAQTGTLSGTVVDATTGETLFGVAVVVTIDGTPTGATTDLEGRFTIPNLPVGSHDVVFRYIGYNTTTVAGVAVNAGETTTLDMQLSEEVLTLGDGEEVVVEARAIRNSEALLLKDRQKAAGVSDAISAEAISRAGASNAADAVEKVTGVSVVGGKYVYVRGLGDRYMNTQLNGSTLPSADPDANTVPFDLFASDMLDNIVTVKTFTPDKPGSFTGGNVDITTRDFPDAFKLSFSSSVGYNPAASLNDNFLTFDNGGTGLFGNRAGDLGVPQAWQNLPDGYMLPTTSEAQFDEALATQVDNMANAFSPVMAPTTGSAPVNHSFSVFTGGSVPFLGRTLGLVGSLSYDRDYSFFENGQLNEWVLTGNVNEKEELDADLQLGTSEGVNEVLLGGLGTVTLQLSPAHKIASTLVYNRSGESRTFFGYGRDLDDNSDPNARFESRLLQYKERELRSLQFSGDHLFPGLGSLRADWSVALAQTSQVEPDRRLFANSVLLPGESNRTEPLYYIAISNYDSPSRYFRNLEEDAVDAKLDLELPTVLSGTIKVGGALNVKDRTFRERLFQYDLNPSNVAYTGDPDAFFSEGTGIVGTTTTRSGRTKYLFGNLPQERTLLRNNYDGAQDIYAGYAMVDFRPVQQVRLIGGARVETTRMESASLDTEARTPVLDENGNATGDFRDLVGDIDLTDVLPALSAVYEASNTMNVRAAYGRTLARPTLREISPFATQNIIGGRTEIGNPFLTRTLVDNFDLRWEWFTGPGEILAVSGFYKAFQDPIETVRASTVNNEVTFRNVAQGRVLGAEFEARQRLTSLPGVLGNLEIGGNLTLTQSSVDIGARELAVIRSVDAGAEGTRALSGQSPYVVNADLSYNDLLGGTTASLLFNVFGPRLAVVAGDGTPDVYERPAPMLDLVVSRELPLGIRLKASAKNLLGSNVELSHEFKGKRYVYESYELGRSFSISLSYAF